MPAENPLGTRKLGPLLFSTGTNPLVMLAEPVSDLISFIMAVAFLIDEFRKMPKEDVVSERS